jgi:hypothetical protein
MKQFQDNVYAHKPDNCVVIITHAPYTKRLEVISEMAKEFPLIQELSQAGKVLTTNIQDLECVEEEIYASCGTLNCRYRKELLQFLLQTRTSTHVDDFKEVLTPEKPGGFFSSPIPAVVGWK